MSTQEDDFARLVHELYEQRRWSDLRRLAAEIGVHAAAATHGNPTLLRQLGEGFLSGCESHSDRIEAARWFGAAIQASTTEEDRLAGITHLCGVLYACGDFARVLDEIPNPVPTGYRYTWSLLIHQSHSYLRLGRAREAVKCATDAVRHASGQPMREQTTEIVLAEALTGCGEYDEAIRRLQELKPLNAAFDAARLILLAEAEWAAGRHKKAAILAAECRNLLAGVDPGMGVRAWDLYARAHLILLRHAAERGDVEAARSIYRGLLADPQCPPRYAGEALHLVSGITAKEGMRYAAETVRWSAAGAHYH